jgi:hypothetical protein
VELATPAGGQDVSVVNIAGGDSYQPGGKISILVDPRDPSYSELPGQPDDTSLEGLVGCAVVILVVLGGVVAGPGLHLPEAAQAPPRPPGHLRGRTDPARSGSKEFSAERAVVIRAGQALRPSAAVSITWFK